MRVKVESVFVLASITHGPAGHGEPPTQYYSLATFYNNPFELGTPRPAFLTREQAEAYKETFDEYNWWTILEIPINNT